jgi:hypothetical protein
MKDLDSEIRDILSENPPSCAEDSGLPEWSKAELDKVMPMITEKVKCVLAEYEKFLVEKDKTNLVMLSLRDGISFIPEFSKKFLSGDQK